MDDGPLLISLLASRGLSERERSAFHSMQRLESLSQRQREWAQNVGAKLGLPVLCAGYVPKTSSWDPAPRAARRAVSTRTRAR